MAADEGFEPSQTESESGVLPLHKSAKRKKYYTRFLPVVNTYFKKKGNGFTHCLYDACISDAEVDGGCTLVLLLEDIVLAGQDGIDCNADDGCYC